MARILIVDDDRNFLNILTMVLKNKGHEVTACQGGEEALGPIAEQEFAMLVSDVQMEPVDGMQILAQAREKRPDMPVLMMTGYGTVESALECLKMGAYDYITKPFKIEDFLMTVQRAVERQGAHPAAADEEAQMQASYGIGEVVAVSDAMQTVCKLVQRTALTDIPLLITGEDGTGRAFVARTIHEASPRKGYPFEVVDCRKPPEQGLAAALFAPATSESSTGPADPGGALRRAEGGSLLLVGVESTPADVQERLLAVLQDKAIREPGGNKVPVNVRLLAATGADLRRLASEGKFRGDLLGRLAVIPIHIPPLRDRREDILPLAMHFLRKCVGQGEALPHISPEVRGAFRHHTWPGNAAEIEGVIAYAFQHSEENVITKECMPHSLLQALESAPGGGGRPSDSVRARSLRAFLEQKGADVPEELGGARAT